jgi:N-acetylglucosamine-6-sulfatase
MRKAVLQLASAALAILFFSAITGSTPTAAQTAPTKPNVVFIIADDMRYDDLKYMPKTHSLLKAKGMSFESAFASNSSCCPNRAAIMRGQYPHNTGVWRSVNAPDGGWEGYRINGNEQDNVATRLDAAGYRTALIGKYFNGYKDTTYVPVGWDHWFATFGFKYFDYDVNDSGTIRHFGASSSDYHTDVLSRQTRTFISTSVARGEPFFAYVAPIAPHTPTTPAPRYLSTYDGAKAPRLPSFNELDVSDKPSWIQALPRLTTYQTAQIDAHHEARVEALQAVDDLVGGVVNELANAGVLGNTYVFFTSDNGWHQGEHRIRDGKWRPYEEDVRMPLLVRGPGVAAGSTTRKLTLNTDYLPTFTDLAGTQTPSYVDGRSLRPVLSRSATAWRSAILLEGSQHGLTGTSKSMPAYYGVRTSDGSKYVEYEAGRVRELYYLGADPYELSNKYAASAPPTTLVSRLQALKGCAADSCRRAENGP